ncbi:Beta-lactamase hydrolase-like protein [Marinomonas gallaica]|uniref:Beta-lactamase hydrolase-like protein n=1 Tax=Marinomonas gallaica TaxID=1806667 RepID=A0A1C3JT61_9GAMM|nr:TIGR01244 family sulfur transferase [Marinomonas gallaica]SBT18342.1 Beta-lactamase hydrolase-like protein [Marinomonas gallaica]SBT22392.1 Beta-lactamase hydrolase-like protein [Marinomonas gallaica]
MNITELSPQYFVSPQIEIADLESLKSQGFVVVVNNRPDGEAEDQPCSSEIQVAAEQAGLRYVYNPVDLKRLSSKEVAAQDELIKANDKVFAFCRTGTRSSVLWVLAKQEDEMSFVTLVADVMKKGFDLGRCLPAMERLKKR